ncbi:bifunctional N-acetylglucosamine-1-phosphate uridyltransferase/glucosamine-1-phosphate acetyltransferase, partial [Campylobacter sp. BCW_8712]
MKTSILILAAGLGTRMKSQKPKVLQELCQKSMILHILKKAFALSDDVSVVLSHQKERVEKEILEHFPKTQILEQDLQNYPGTAGALRGFEPKNE